MAAATPDVSTSPLIALVGNPNCGKTALFNRLTGAKQKVGNYAGVTVERKEGQFVSPAGQNWRLLDLPGAYSLLAATPDEAITRDVIAGVRAGESAPVALVCVVDATNLRLNLRMVLELQTLGVPMVLANARLSDKSLRQGQRLAALMRPAAQSLSMVLAQTADDARRLTEMGAPKVQVCGNVKFDMTPSEELLARGRSWRQTSNRPLVLAASTREGEEPGLLQAWQALRASPAWPADSCKAPRLFIVPRHPQRFDEVAALITAQGFTLSRRNQWPDAQPDATANRADVWLGDSMGEMPAYYAAASAALLGGSFAPLGGQNLIEAAACGCPLIMGGSTFNFADAAQLSELAGAAFRVQNWLEGTQKALEFCDESVYAHHMKKALEFAQTHRGAARLMTHIIWGITSP